MRKRASHQLEDRILALGPSAYWPLNKDDTENLTTFGREDQSGNGHTLTPQNSIVLGDGDSITYDSTDTCTLFINSSNWYYTSSYNPFVNGRGFTACGIAYRGEHSSSNSLFGGDSGGAGPPALLLSSGAGTSTIEFWPNTSMACSWSGGWPNDSLYHKWALVFDEPANTVDFYIDGQRLTQQTSSVQWSSTPGNFELGANGPTPSNYWDGAMSHVAVYERCLTASEVRQLHMAATGQHRQALYTKDRILQLSPTLYWPLNYEYLATDLSGNGRHGTATGLTVGGGPTLTNDPGDSSTHWTDVGQWVQAASYSPYVNGTVRTFAGLAHRDGTSLLIGGSESTSPALGIGSGSPTTVEWDTQPTGGSSFSITQTPGTPFAWAFIFDDPNNEAKFYLNGSLLSTESCTTVYNASPGVFRVGQSPTFGTHNGAIAHVAVWERALTPTEISHVSDAMVKGPPGVIIEAAV